MKFKKDIVDEYVHPISNKFINQEKEKRILQIPAGLTKADLGPKFEGKSDKSKRKIINKTIKKFNFL